ncbi:hypothetical protein ACN47E_006286 [Coniothyrium glycines]
MQAFAPKHVFRRYNVLHTRAALEATPDFTWCLAASCSAGQVHRPSMPRFKCRHCKKSHCTVHNVRWHQGETCSEYDYRTDKSLRMAEEKKSRMLVASISKACPGCGRSIEKTYGCDHMTCTRCMTEFCWLCLAEYVKVRNYRDVVHKEDCLYHEPIMGPMSEHI